MTIKLQDKNQKNYILTTIDYSTFNQLYNEIFTHYFRGRINFDIAQFTEKSPHFLCHQLNDGCNIIGLFCGYESDFGIYKMHYSVIHPDYRRLNLYHAFLLYSIQSCQEKSINRIVSEHSNSNNPIILAKMRHNFYITNLNVCPFYGTEVQLTYFIDKDLENIFKFRCGDITLNESISKRCNKTILAYKNYFSELTSN